MSHTNPPKDGLAAANESDGFGKPSAEALKLGYEPDGYHALSVISVPVLVIVFFVLAFGTTTVLFAFLNKTPADPSAHPLAVERNGAPLNDRLQRIGTNGEVEQPRLEPLRARTGDNRAISRPEDPKAENPPYMYPEDNRADTTRTPELFRTGWLDKDHHVARVALTEIMTAPTASLFPVQKNGSKPLSSLHRPTPANAGQGAEHAEAEMPKLPAAAPADDHKHDVKKDEHKKDDHKDAPKAPTKDEVKKEEPKKEEPKGEVKK